MRYTARDELMRRCRKLTTKVVTMMERTEAPAAIIDTAMNWLLPAKTRIDMRPISKGDSPAFWANTPKAIPMGIYPKQIGHPADNPSVMVPLIDMNGHPYLKKTEAFYLKTLRKIPWEGFPGHKEASAGEKKLLPILFCPSVARKGHAFRRYRKAS